MTRYINRKHLSKWDARFLDLADHIATWSKGPRKRVGAVIVRSDKTVASVGYNGAPKDFDDEIFLQMSREKQHEIVIHAEHNALGHMNVEEDLKSLTLYVSPLPVCKTCAHTIAGLGFRRVVAYCGQISKDWLESAKEAEKLLHEAGVEYTIVLKDK